MKYADEGTGSGTLSRYRDNTPPQNRSQDVKGNSKGHKRGRHGATENYGGSAKVKQSDSRNFSTKKKSSKGSGGKG